MTKFEATLELSTDNLILRREQLETELKETILEHTFTEMRKAVNEELLKYGITGATEASWDFYYESDDEGGTDPYLEYISIKGEDGDEIAMDEYFVEKKSTWSNGTYTVSLDEEMRELFYEFKGDLHDYGITEITLA